MLNILVKNKKYEGKFVATASFSDSKIITSGDSMKEVSIEARKHGYKNPVVFFVPESDVSYIL